MFSNNTHMYIHIHMHMCILRHTHARTSICTNTHAHANACAHKHKHTNKIHFTIEFWYKLLMFGWIHSDRLVQYSAHLLLYYTLVETNPNVLTILIAIERYWYVNLLLSTLLQINRANAQYTRVLIGQTESAL